MNETQLRFCDICAKLIIFQNTSKHNKSNDKKCFEKFNVIVKTYELIKLNIIDIF